MKKSDFFDEKIVAFEISKHHHHLEHESVLPQSSSVVYYEWDKQESKWLKLRETDPEPDQSIPNGSFDGQIIEIDL